MKEKIFEMSEYGPFKAKVDERFHKLGQDCPDDGWVAGYLYRDLCGGEIVPIIFNAPCRWRVVEETIEPVGFHIAQWIKVEDRLPEYEETVMVACHYKDDPEIDYIFCHRTDRNEVLTDKNGFAIIPDFNIIHWMPIIPPKED